MEITVGMTGEATALVEKEDTAQAVGSGSLLVYATPCMAALMEGAACEAIEQALPQGQTSVGTALNLEHISATPVGLEVRARAEVLCHHRLRRGWGNRQSHPYAGAGKH